MAKILIAGCGSIGRALGDKLAAKGHAVVGIKRNPTPADGCCFPIIQADLEQAADLDKLQADFDRVVFIASPTRGMADSYQRLYQTGLDNLIANFAQAVPSPAWIFVSSTSVYAQDQGEWIDEDSPATSSHPGSRFILAAENKLLAFQPDSVIVRFSGIYGPGREYLLRLASMQPAIQKSPPYYTNRIHERDCVGVLEFLLEKSLSGTTLAPRYLASDHHPAPLWDVVSWLTAEMACAPPQAKSVGPDAGQNKRCANNRLTELGYRFIYPDYRSGYAEMVKAHRD